MSPALLSPRRWAALWRLEQQRLALMPAGERAALGRDCLIHLAWTAPL